MHLNREYVHVNANIERFSGFAEVYDRYRPQPPTVLVDVLIQLAQVARPALVVDLGSGTGRSTALWAARAAQVVGVEPSADMRQQAERRAAGLPNVRYVAGWSHATGLPDASAEIVTISQALHWMEPEPTFAEVARILRPGGVFAAYDCDWPPTLHWQVEEAYDACVQQANALEREHGTARGLRYWNKRQHGERMRASGHFRFVKEIKLHHVEQGDAERIVGVALSQGQIAGLLKHGLSEDEIGITALRTAAHAALGDRSVPWYWSYKVRLGVRR